MARIAAIAAILTGLAAGHAPAEAPAPIPVDLPAAEARAARGVFGKIAAVAVEQHGETVYRRRFAAGQPGDPVDIRSAGKSLTALAVGAAIADGKLPSVDVAVWPYLGDARQGGYQAITIRDLLTMSSALACDDGQRQSPGQEERMYRTRDWTAFALSIPLRPDYVRDASGRGPLMVWTPPRGFVVPEWGSSSSRRGGVHG